MTPALAPSIPYEALFDACVELAADGILFIGPDGKIRFVNRQTESMFGYPREELIGESIEKLVPPSGRGRHEMHRMAYQSHAVYRPMGAGFKLAGLRRDGTEFPVEISLRPIAREPGPSVIAVVRDITARREGETSGARLAAVVQSSVDGILTQDLAGTITSWNHACKRLLGYSEEEALGQPIAMLLPPGTVEEENAIMAMLLRGEPVAIREACRLRKDGSQVWVSVSASPIRGTNGEVVGATAIMRDVSHERRAAELMQESLREKEVLLTEVHHRVKNNLQVVASLLSLQAEFVSDAKARSLFMDSRTRVRSIALVHEKLYRSKDLASLDFRQYIEELVAELRRFYRPEGGVTIELDAKSVPLGMDPAINCGLIVSELVSNALKHAFPGGRSGTLWISLEALGADRIRLVVRDDGVGLRSGFGPGAPQTMGMRLVDAMVKQMDGTLEVLPGPGTTFVLELRVGESGGADG